MAILIGLLLIMLLLLSCRVLWYAAICMRPRVQELRAQRRYQRELSHAHKIHWEQTGSGQNAISIVLFTVIGGFVVCTFLLLITH